LREIKLFVADVLMDAAIFSGLDKTRSYPLSRRMTRRMRNYKAMVDVESLQGVVTCADAQSDKVLNSDSINEGESDVESRTLRLIEFQAYFYESFSTLEDHRMSSKVFSPLQIPCNPRNAWRLGFRVIRGLLSGRLPQNVHQGIFCVMMAHEMREESECYRFSQKEYISTIEVGKRLTNEDYLMTSVDGEMNWRTLKIASYSSASVF
jgi:hypothetical protein